MANKLNYKRADIVKALQDALDGRQAARNAKQVEIDANNKEASDRIKSLLDQYPEFLVAVNNFCADQFGESASHSDLEKEVAKAYGRGVVSDIPDPNAFDPDKELKRLLRVYEASSDETVELEEGEPVLKFI